MSVSNHSHPLNLTSAALHSAAVSSLSLPPQPPPSTPVVPPPAFISHAKLIPKTRFVVDGFKNADHNFSVSYFLSHFHSDHYTGLSPQWSKGIIYCSSTTAKLLHQILNVPQPFIFPLPVSQSVAIDGSEVWLVDANHCPGAVQFLFKVPVNYEGGVRFEKYVHTGDFRYCDDMKNEGVMSQFVGADSLFLDTTYCNPKFVFPSQEESIDYIVGVIERLGIENEGVIAKDVLFLVATYVIGKEKILLEIARRCKKKIYVNFRKMGVLRALGLGDSEAFTENESDSDVHVVGWNVLGETWPYFRPNFQKMNEIMTEKGYSKVVGFVPTGWTYEVKKNKFAVRTNNSFEIHLVPYSEHSNYDELREYVKFLKPKRIIPTVGADVEKVDGKHANALRKHFAGLVDEMAVKQEFLMGFLRGGTGALDEEKDSPAVYNNIPDQEAEVNFPAMNCCSNVEQESVLKNSPQQESATQKNSKSSPQIEGSKENDLEKSVQELRDCLPNWVTLSQMLDLLSGSDGNIVDAVSNFYERETEFHEQVFSSTSVSFAAQGSSEKDPALPFELEDRIENVSFSQSFKLSGSGSGSIKKSISISPGKRKRNLEKSSGVSPGKRKRNLDGKVTKKARADSTRNSNDPKQCTITKFFNRKLSGVSTVSKTEVNNSDGDEGSLSADATGLYKEKLDQFIQIVNGDESLRSSAATIVEKAKGDINVALDMYYNDNDGVTNEGDNNMLDRNKLKESESKISVCSVDRNAELVDCSKLETKSDIVSPSSIKNDLSVNNISLPPEQYSPVEHACWRKGQPAPYIHIARTFDLVEKEKGKIKVTLMLCSMFRSLLALSPEDVLPAVYLCTNKIAPEHENMELNIGGSIIVAALEEVCGTNRSKINQLYNSLGDLGDVAQVCRQTQSLLAPPPALTIQGLFSCLRKISVQTGTGSTTRKKSLIMNLLCSCREKEMKFLVRTLVRNLRIGAMMRTVLPALAQAIVMNSTDERVAINLKDHMERLSRAVVEAYNILPNLDLLIPSLVAKGIDFSSSSLSMVPGVPIKPMLAKITNGATQVLKIFQSKAFTCEYKYDGQRAQIHRTTDGSIHVFSRKGDETTSKFPDLIDTIKDCCGHVDATFFLDAEVVAIDRKNNMKLMSFQELSSRERGSRDSLITIDKIKVDICIFAFDIMFVNGEQLLDLPLRQRRKHLKCLFGEEKPGYFEYAREMTVESQDADVNDEVTLNRLSTFLDDALRSSCEGIMVKSLDVNAGYIPSKRSDAWLKVKRDYVDGLNDSLDLVPIGAWHGNGRKAGWFSPFLMACYNPDTEEFQSVCRVMSGFSDAFYTEMKEFFSGDKVLSKKPPYYQTAEMPDLWFSPELVWQIRGADFTISPVHHAALGLVHPSRGISVRFPRFIHSVLDRNPEECSSAEDIAEMFNSQTRKIDINIKQ